MNNLTIVMYHYVRPIKDSDYPNIKGLELEGFKRQLDYLSNHFSIITAEQLINYSQGSSDLPSNPCYLTFDDGYKDHLRYVLPELLTRKIQGSFFPPADAVEKRKMLDVNAIHYILASTNDYTKLANELDRYCLEYGFTQEDVDFFYKKWATSNRYDPPTVVYIKEMLQHALPHEVRELIISRLFEKYVQKHQVDFADDLYISISDTKELINNGMYVGSHGCEHIWLDKVSEHKQQKEIKASLKFLKKVGARTDDWIMCYPYGGYNEETLNILRANKCSIGLTTKVGHAKLNQSNMLELSRFDTNDFPQ